MMGLYFSILGDWAVALINFYRRHQVIFNLLVLVYGILLAVAHRNLRKVHSALKEVTGEDNPSRIRIRLKDDPLEEEKLSSIRRSLFLPILASNWYFSFYRYSIDNALKVLEKQHARGRRR